MVRGNGGGWIEPRREHPQGLTGALATLRSEKGGQLGGGQVVRNMLLVRGYMGWEGLGEKVEGDKTESVGTGSGDQREWALVLPGNPRPEEKGDNW